jgi:hypothetical protein
LTAETGKALDPTSSCRFGNLADEARTMEAGEEEGMAKKYRVMYRDPVD